MKKAIKERTGKTEAECEDIIAQYRKLRAKAKVNNAKRTEKLKSNDDLITGTNVITPVAQIEKDAEIVKAKIEKQVEQIENKAEREVVKKDKTKDEVKVEVEQKVVKQLAKLSDDMVTSATTFVKNIQTELKKVDKTEAKNFLLGLRNEIDALLSKFGDGGSTIETYNITQNESASSVNPSKFARGGGVNANNNVVRVKALIKKLDNTPYSIGLAILRERLLTYTLNDLEKMKENPNAFGNFFISTGMYEDYFNTVFEELKFEYEDGGSVDDGDFEDGGSVDDGDFAKGGGVGSKLDSGVYRIGKPIKVNANLYEQKIVEIFDNGDIATASDYGIRLNDFKSQKYPIISKEQFDAQYKYARGGGVGNPSKKQMLDYLNMYFDNYSELRTIAIEEDNILTRRMLNSLDNEELQMAYDDAKYEMRAETQFARGGGVRIGSDGREYPFGSAWALEHNKNNKSEKYEIPISSRKS